MVIDSAAREWKCDDSAVGVTVIVMLVSVMMMIVLFVSGNVMIVLLV